LNYLGLYKESFRQTDRQPARITTKCNDAC